MRNYYGLRCSAKRVTKHKVTFRLKTVPQAEPTPHHRLRAELSRCGSVRRGSWFPPGTNSIPRPCFAALEGKAKSGRVARLTGQKGFSPNTETFSAVHNISVVCLSRLARYPGVSGGGAALSSLCRRFPGGDIMNLTSRRSPLSGLSFSLFFFLRRKKNG